MNRSCDKPILTRMSPTPLPPDILAAASLFRISGTPEIATTLGNGLINDTYLVTTSDNRQYVLQRINSSVFKDPEALQNNLKLISDHIRKSLEREQTEDIERRIITTVDTTGGKRFANVNGEIWRMTHYISGSHTVENVTPEMARLTGMAFARFHKYLSTDDAPELSETIPDFHNLDYRISQLRNAVATDSADKLQWVADIVEYLLSRSEEMLLAERLHEQGKLPKRIAHCDTKVNNILFDQDGSILCVIDLDTTMPGFLFSDFGDFVRTACNTGKEDDEDLSAISVDMNIYAAFKEGYLTEADFLTETERELLPYGAKRLTYMQSVRFLTDYINGDIYYKTTYPEHNLIRTRAQIKLLHEIDTHFNDM